MSGSIRHAKQPLQKRKDIIRSQTAVQHAVQIVILANEARHSHATGQVVHVAEYSQKQAMCHRTHHEE
jgi:hypothetical protein